MDCTAVISSSDKVKPRLFRVCLNCLGDTLKCL